MNLAWQLIYILCSFLFIFGLKLLSGPRTARLGNLLSSSGMLLAVVVTLLQQEILDFRGILLGVAVGALVGGVAARFVVLTAMPEMVALFNGFGGMASLLVAWGEFLRQPSIPGVTAVTMVVSILIGGVTFSGSVVAWGKLSEWLLKRQVRFPGQHIVNGGLLALALAGAILFCLGPKAYPALVPGLIGVALVLGVLLVIPIGGADMPVVISLLNSYSGLAACATGFVLQNHILIVTGSLVGASGLVLTQIMCKAMNRNLANVMFSGFGSAGKGSAKVEGEARPINPEDAYAILEAAQSVVIVPGYGLAVAQAQHALRELAQMLESNGAEVTYAIHPVAGRMPGHMNVLLAEANVPYEQLAEMDAVNPIMDTVDVCVVIGANDVVNPAAKEDSGSPLYGMPIIEVGRARTVMVIKRSLAPGFAGVENHLFYKDNTRMLFGDAKSTLQHLVSEFKEVPA